MLVSLAVNTTLSKYGPQTPDWVLIALWLIPLAPLGWWVYTHEKLKRWREWLREQFSTKPKRTVVAAIAVLIIVAASLTMAFLGVIRYVSKRKALAVAPTAASVPSPAPRSSAPVPNPPTLTAKELEELAKQLAKLLPPPPTRNIHHVPLSDGVATTDQTKTTPPGNNNGQVGGSISTGPCSNVQTGGSNNQQTTNCTLDDLPPKIRWTKTEGNGLAGIQIWVDKAYPDAKFAVICDRPCAPVSGVIDWGGRHPNVIISPEVETGTPDGYPNVAAFVVDHPAVFSTDISLKYSVRSSDGLPFTVKDVMLLNIGPKR
jgi:hypothetical protein